MELRNLITFIHVAKLGSFTKAAEQLGYSQSTISFQIKQLEDELGRLLFERINHTITLTERGHELLPMHFVASSTSRFAGKKNLSIKDIINELFVLTEYGQGYRRVFDRELAKKSLEIAPVLEIGRTDKITALPAESDMVSYLPDFVTKELIDAGALCHLDVCDMGIDIWKQLIYHKNKWMSKSLKVFIEYIRTHEFNA